MANSIEFTEMVESLQDLDLKTKEIYEAATKLYGKASPGEIIAWKQEPVFNKWSKCASTEDYFSKSKQLLTFIRSAETGLSQAETGGYLLSGLDHPALQGVKGSVELNGDQDITVADVEKVCYGRTQESETRVLVAATEGKTMLVSVAQLKTCFKCNAKGHKSPIPTAVRFELHIPLMTFICSDCVLYAILHKSFQQSPQVHIPNV